MVGANEQMILEIEQEVLQSYQNETLLALFLGKDIGNIGITQWKHKNIDDIPEAALTAAGYNPQEAKINPNLFGDDVFTVAEELDVPEVEWEQIKNFGLDPEAMRMLGKKVGAMASRYLFRGTDEDGNIPKTQYNFLRDAGTGDGALERPLMQSTTSAGVWSTYSNKSYDLSLLLGQLVNRGYNIASTVIFYPMIAHTPMSWMGNATNDLSAINYLKGEGVMDVIKVPNSYMYTAAGATPTAALFDLWAVDMSQVKIGYTRTERVRTITPHNDVRNTKVEAEVWFCPYMIPRPWADDSKIYKGVSRISAIAP